MNSSIKILLVEDHKLIRVGIRTLFEETDGYEVIAEADNGKDAISKAENTLPDVILLDIGLPDISGIKVLKALRDKNIESKVVILTSHEDSKEVLSAFSYNINAYVIKDIQTDSLLEIVKTVNKGAMWFDPKIVPLLRETNGKLIPQKTTSRAKFRSTHADLTEREYEVLKLVVDGKSNNEIAQDLCISEHTAKAHVCNIIQKLLVEDRTQAAVKALKEGIIQ